MTEILLKVALNTLTLIQKQILYEIFPVFDDFSLKFMVFFNSQIDFLRFLFGKIGYLMIQTPNFTYMLISPYRNIFSVFATRNMAIFQDGGQITRRLSGILCMCILHIN